MPTKLTLEDCHKTAEERGGKCLSTEYKNKKTKMRWQCKEGHEWETACHNIRNGNRWCKKCAYKQNGINSRLPIQDCHTTAEERGGKCLSTEYISSKTKMKWQCEEGHKWESSYGHIRNSNGWCPTCYNERRGETLRLSIEKCHKTAEERGGKCLSTEYKNKDTKMKWQCKEGHEWKSTYGNIKNQNHWCPTCYDERRGETLKLSIEDCQKLAEERGGKCLSTEYKNNRTKMRWQCQKYHEWEAKFHDIKDDNNWCPHCHIFKHEEESRTIIENIYNKQFPKGRYTFLINPETDKNLELDGYNEELKIAFEYQGRQHYEAVEYFGGKEAFKEQQKKRLY